MSILLPNAQQFVIVGETLKQELENDEPFRNYFQDKKDQLKTLEHIDQFKLDDYPNLSQTLFVVKHFDLNPNLDRDVSKKTSGDPVESNSCNNNNNVTPTPAKSIASVVSEFGSDGYTTDYGDMDDSPIDKHVIQQMDFDGGRCFSILSAQKCCIIGSIALLQTIRQLKDSEEQIRMVPSERPLHNLAMQNNLITFSGISSKLEAQQLLTLTRYMGAKSREDVTNKTTHLVAGNSRGIKYRRALELGLSIMSTTWVKESFRLAQTDIEFDASLPEVIQLYKLKPFQGLYMAFVGFKDEDAKELSDLTLANQGSLVEATDPICSHIIVDAISGSDDENTQLLNSINQPPNTHVVYREWFWASLEMEGKANEDGYAVPGFKFQNRRSSRAHRGSIGYNSFSNVLSPMLDYSRSPESMSSTIERQVSRSQSISVINEIKPDLSQITPRHRASLELLQTERNYVKILETIVNLFKVPLEKHDIVDPILPMTDVKIIFGNLTPIYEVHKRMLTNLENLIEKDWRETNSIGKVFVTHSIDLLKAYPPFVNFFEDTKKTINSCDLKYPRFHAFLKRCQSRIECNRESLTEMLIRPVQRLPSITLIINELIKRTDDTNPDKKYLVEALESIRRVMNLINEDKRKTEGQIAMFDIVNNIEDCPPNLLSALRRFIHKVEARILFMNSENEVTPSKSHKVVLFLFSDLIEICKIRSLKRSHSSRGNKTYVPIRRGLTASQNVKVSSKKEHRHLDDLRLCDIMNLYKVCKSPGLEDAFVIQARPSPKYDQNFRYYPFIVEDDSITKSAFVDRVEECLCTCDDPERVSEYTPNDSRPIANDEIDFGYANVLVSGMEKSRLSRVLSIRQALLSPSVKAQRNHHFN